MGQSDRREKAAKAGAFKRVVADIDHTMLVDAALFQAFLLHKFFSALAPIENSENTTYVGWAVQVVILEEFVGLTAPLLNIGNGAQDGEHLANHGLDDEVGTGKYEILPIGTGARLLDSPGFDPEKSPGFQWSATISADNNVNNATAGKVRVALTFIDLDQIPATKPNQRNADGSFNAPEE